MPTVIVMILSRICAEHTNQRSAELVYPATLIRLQLEQNVGNDMTMIYVGFDPYSLTKTKS